MNCVALVLFFISTCYCEDFSERPRNFSIELLRHTQVLTSGHEILSPFGIWTLMAGLAIGATDNSYNELSKAFILPKNKDSLIKGYKDLTKVVLDAGSQSGVSLISRNFVFLDKTFTVNPEFKNVIQKDFKASVNVLDFSDPNAARIANTDIEKSDVGVSNVLNDDSFKDSKMILTNVISFKGLWSQPFNKSNTKLEPFYNDKKMVIGSVNMMYQKGEFPFSNMQSIKSFVLELPYGDIEKYSMIFILPYPNTPISDMYKLFATVTFKDIVRQLKEDIDTFGFEEIEVSIPRFRIKTNIILNKPLNEMGVNDIFQPTVASFGMITNENIFVSAIVHTADIEVTEAGTTASASTSASISNRIKSPSFYARTPFLYFIFEKSTSTVIFAGVYSKPSVY